MDTAIQTLSSAVSGSLPYSNPTVITAIQMLSETISSPIDALRQDFCTRLQQSVLDAATINWVSQWFQENKVIAISRYQFGSTVAIVTGHIDINSTLLVTAQRGELWLSVLFEDHTDSVEGLCHDPYLRISDTTPTLALQHSATRNHSASSSATSTLSTLLIVLCPYAPPFPYCHT
jgi:hypothetical protein